MATAGVRDAAIYHEVDRGQENAMRLNYGHLTTRHPLTIVVPWFETTRVELEALPG